MRNNGNIILGSPSRRRLIETDNVLEKCGPFIDFSGW